MKKERGKITKKGVAARIGGVLSTLLLILVLNLIDYGEFGFIGAVKELILIILFVEIVGFGVEALFRISYLVDPQSKEYLAKREDGR